MDFAAFFQGKEMNTHDIKLPPLPGWTTLCYINASRYSQSEKSGMWLETLLKEYATAAIEADRRATKKQLNAYRGLVNSLEARLAHLQSQHDELKKSTKPDFLASERAANTMLTEELEAYRKHTTDLISEYQEKIRALEAENYSLVSDLDNRRARQCAASAVEADRQRIVGILKGIDETEIDSKDGWWETCTGAAFGAGVLKRIKGGDYDQE